LARLERLGHRDHLKTGPLGQRFRLPLRFLEKSLPEWTGVTACQASEDRNRWLSRCLQITE
jgi:hypothetical protein